MNKKQEIKEATRKVKNYMEEHEADLNLACEEVWYKNDIPRWVIKEVKKELSK